MRDLFLCHTGADKAWVEMLAKRIENERDVSRALSVWFDDWDIQHGENILKRIEEGLKESRFVGVVLSPAFTKAEWPALEWQSQVHDDPAGKKARILPILLHKFDPRTSEPIEIPLPLRLLRYFDFTNPKNEAREYGRLVARLKGITRRGSDGGTGPSQAEITNETPDTVRESIASNLLHVDQLPPLLYSDLTSAKRYTDVWERLSGKMIPPFVLNQNRLYSFYKPDSKNNPFASLLTGTDVTSSDPHTWVGDATKQGLLVQLLNTALKEHCYKLKIRNPPRSMGGTRRDRYQFYCPTYDGRPRHFTWGGKSVRPRTIAKVIPQSDGTLLGVHYAARMRFVVLGDDIYLAVEPGWMFTSDGVVPVGGAQMGVLSTKWGGRERNASILRHVLMWALLLAEGHPEIRIVGGRAAKIVLSTVPAHAHTESGIADDQIRLDLILGGEGAGEIVTAEGELDAVAEMNLDGEVSDADADDEADYDSDIELGDLFNQETGDET